MLITLTAIDKGGDFALAHDLNFQKNLYEAKHTIVGSLIMCPFQGTCPQGN